MKNFISIILIAFALALSPGCGTTPKQATYASIVSSRVTIDSAWIAFRNQRALGKVSDAQWEEAVRAIVTYRLARNTAIDIARTSTPNTPALDSALIAISKAYEPLVKILVQYVPELEAK